MMPHSAMMPSQKRPVTRPQSTQLRISADLSAKHRTSRPEAGTLRERERSDGLEDVALCVGLDDFVLPEGLEDFELFPGLDGGDFAAQGSASTPTPGLEDCVLFGELFAGLPDCAPWISLAGIAANRLRDCARTPRSARAEMASQKCETVAEITS